MAKQALFIFTICVFGLAACGGGGGTSMPAPTAAQPTSGNGGGNTAQSCAMQGMSTPTPVPNGPAPAPASGLTVPSGFKIDVIANIAGARELSFAPNGDLFVGTMTSKIYLIPNADSAGNAGTPHVYADVGDSPAAGVVVATTNTCAVYAGTQFGVYMIPYAIGDQTARSSPAKIASMRPGGSSDHITTSVAVAGTTLYASVGASCDACTESDPTRAAILQMQLDGSGMTQRAVRIRNAIALTVNPNTGTLWAGVAGQDTLALGHPYEFFDATGLHSGIADYGWPKCEENRHAYTQGADCSNTVVPLVEFPAYETVIGATIYPATPAGQYKFPQQYAGGAFVSLHGSWHILNGAFIAPPRVVFVPMSGDAPIMPVDWNDPAKQWSDFVGGFQRADNSRIARPSGITVGPQGDIFLADDQDGNIYRIRP
ncbi:MAG: PQQ-dependent sugar dehydrogenase [Vulcanimicrobiaceae bacterium]